MKVWDADFDREFFTEDEIAASDLWAEKVSAGMGVRNWIDVYGISPFVKNYAYIDTAEHYAEPLLEKHGVRVRRKGEMAHPDHGYRVIMCSVPRWQTQRFTSAMAELTHKMLVCGKTDYPEFCEKLIGRMYANRGEGVTYGKQS